MTVEPFEHIHDVVIDDQKVDELLTRGVVDVLPSADSLREELLSGRRLTAYMGVDPTAPDLHVGHQSQLLKLRRLQELGHEVVLLIGDFTAMIGDPTDKGATRVLLTHDQVLENAQGYKQQAGKILDFESSTNPVSLRYNSEWLGEMSFADVLELASEFTVQQMMERDMFQDRIKQGKALSLVEMMYPMMQGWDSVKLGVDIELGGSDQIFNMLVGSTLVRRHLAKQKFVIAGKILADPSGKKIGKSEGNMITLNDLPSTMYHKVMMWGDDITPHALELCTNMDKQKIQEMSEKLATGELSGIDGKMILARTIVADLHGDDAAEQAEQNYLNLTNKNTSEINPTSLSTVDVRAGANIVDLVVSSGIVESKSQARRLLDSGAVRINNQKVDSSWQTDELNDGSVLRVGKLKPENHRVIKIKSEQS